MSDDIDKCIKEYSIVNINTIAHDLIVETERQLANFEISSYAAEYQLLGIRMVQSCFLKMMSRDKLNYQYKPGG